MNIKRFFTDQRVSNIIRWWSASAVYFFIGWGTSLGAQSLMIDLIFFLGVAIAIFEMFVVNPVVFNMFNLKNPLRMNGHTVLWKVRYRLFYVLKTICLIVGVFLIYQIINLSAIRLMGLAEDAVFLPGEPIMFGIFYMIFYLLFESFTMSIKRRMKETTQ